VVAQVTDRMQRLDLSSGYVHLACACHLIDADVIADFLPDISSGNVHLSRACHIFDGGELV
jgi:hypothetical protein